MDYMFNPKLEKMPKDKIKDLQLKRLKETVHLVYDNVSFYKKKFKELNIKAGPLTGSAFFC